LPKAKPEKPFNSGQWTAARMNSFIKGGIRTLSRRWPPRYESLNLALIGKRLDPATGKMSNRYKCAACGDMFKQADVQVDHIDPVVSVEGGFIDWNIYIKRMYCEVDGFQVLCSQCHNVKTQNERKKRKENASK
jgi:5-methylcytosine-specific restriction endonuclease McrA